MRVGVIMAEADTDITDTGGIIGTVSMREEGCASVSAGMAGIAGIAIMKGGDCVSVSAGTVVDNS